jgi:hypothetical protein
LLLRELTFPLPGENFPWEGGLCCWLEEKNGGRLFSAVVAVAAVCVAPAGMLLLLLERRLG